MVRSLLIGGLLLWAGASAALEEGGSTTVEAVVQELQGELGRAPSDEEVVRRLNALTVAAYGKGDYAQAEAAARLAWTEGRGRLGEEHPVTLVSLNNLAALYDAQGRYGEAEPLLQRALETRERVLGREHPDSLVSLNNLAALYKSQGRYGEAEPLYQRALETSERVLGREHPDSLSSLNNLAGLYYAQGRYGEAEPLYQRALETSERVLGPDHPDTVAVQLNLAVALINQNRVTQALRTLRTLDSRLHAFVTGQLATTERERVRRGWLLSQSSFQDVVFTLALKSTDTDAHRLAADILLRWHRLAGEEEGAIAHLLRTSHDPQLLAEAEALRRARTEYSHLVNSANPAPTALRAAQVRMERQEVALAARSRPFASLRAGRQVEWEAVQSALPRGSALLALRMYKPVDFKTGRAGAPHWLALLLPQEPEAGPELYLQDLGPVSATIPLLRELRESGSDAAAQALYATLFGRLDEQLAGYRELFIAPDGELELAPFARLRLPDGRFWVERQPLHRLLSGRDLLPTGTAGMGEGMVVFGGIDYSTYGPAETAAAKEGPAASGGELLAASRRLRDERGEFKLLEHTGVEAEGVAGFYWDYHQRAPVVWQGAEASEQRLKSLARPPRILHLATHGFFLSQSQKRAERPATLAGLALAGANLGRKGQLSPTGEDGLLYALEVQDLYLEGTELVTLSACDTALGQVDYSEGVYGLVRAFRIAGTRDVLMTLWPLDDALAQGFMEGFYRRLFDGSGKRPAEALRETQLAWIGDSDPRRRDPKYWAPYVLVEGR